MNNIVEHPIFISSCYNTYLKHINNKLLTDFIIKLEKTDPTNARIPVTDIETALMGIIKTALYGWLEV